GIGGANGSGNGGAGGAGIGGALSNAGSSVIGNATIAANSASQGTGGFAGSSTPSGVNGANGAATGGGVANTGVQQLRATNTLLSANTGGTTSNCSGTITDGGHNLEFNTNTCAFTIAFQHGNPNLDTLKSNGGPTQTMALLSGSAAKDTADPTACAAPPTSGKDQRGLARRTDLCSIGAYEADVAIPNPVPPSRGPSGGGMPAPVPLPRVQPGNGGGPPAALPPPRP
ncbi:MAG: choice-of-anchor Q domain-containing protein, partial [Thermomicrobiales bacterium]